MAVTLSVLSQRDGEEFVDAVRASRSLHHPWIDMPDTAGRFAAFTARMGADDQVLYLLRHASCGGLAGFVHVGNIVRGAFQSAYVGYGAFAGHEGRGLMTAGLQEVVGRAFGELRLHRLEANIQPANSRSLALARRVGFEKEGFSPRYLMVDGDWRDHERWALRADTYTPPRGGLVAL
jgi:[ribosomal protein S5]-alanine N-acetyltransferase